MNGLEANKDVVRGYFQRVASGDESVLDELTDDVRWWVPQGSSLGGTYEGKAAVAELMQGGVGAYASDVPMKIEVGLLVAEGDWVCAQVELSAGTPDGRAYRNHYHFAFRIRDGAIAEVKEYVDTHYVHEMLGL